MEQNVRNICGFHAFYNAKCMLRNLLCDVPLSEQVNNRPAFWKEYNNMISRLLKCRSSNFVTNQDKKELSEDLETPLEREHLRYLLKNDTELNSLRKVAYQKKISLAIEPIFYSFG